MKIKKPLSQISLFLFTFIVIFFLLFLSIAPSAYLIKQFLYYNSIKSNGNEAIATVIEISSHSYKTKKNQLRYFTTEKIKFDSYLVEKSLSGGPYSTDVNLLIVYDRYQPDKLYLGGLDDSILSVIYVNEDLIVFILIWLLLSPFLLFFVIKGTTNLIKEYISESVAIKIFFNSFKLFLQNSKANGYSNIYYFGSYLLRFLLIIFILYGISNTDSYHSKRQLERGFFKIFRWILSSSFLSLLLYYSHLKEYNWFLVFLIFLIVFNPIFLFPFKMDFWRIIEFTAVITLAISFFFQPKRINK